MKKIITGTILLLIFLFGVFAPVSYPSSPTGSLGISIFKAEAKKTKKKKKKTKKKKKKKTKKAKKDSELKSFSKSLVSDNEDERTKVVKIYNWITSNISYDDGKKDLTAHIEGDPYKTFKSRKGVCSDYSDLLFTMLKDVGVKSEEDSGSVYESTGNLWGLGSHAWNKINIDGQELYMDATWDAGRDQNSYLYFLIPEKCFQIDHIVGSVFFRNVGEQENYIKDNSVYLDQYCPVLKEMKEWETQN